MSDNIFMLFFLYMINPRSRIRNIKYLTWTNVKGFDVICFNFPSEIFWNNRFNLNEHILGQVSSSQHLKKTANAIKTYLFSGLWMTSAGDQISDVQFLEKSVIQLKH